MKKSLVVLLMSVVVMSSGCVASRKFVRGEVKTSSDMLTTRIDKNDGEIKETQDSVDRVSKNVDGVDQKVAALDTRTTQGLNGLKSDVNGVNSKVDTVNTKTGQIAGGLATLDQQFQNRNNYSMATEKSIPFKFDSAKLDAATTSELDAVATALMRDADAIVVLEGHTDSKGDAEYNLKLGERRVDAVRRYLATEKSVPVYRIHQISFGSAKPIAANDTREGREKNRSVTVTVLLPKADGSVASAK